MIIETFIVLSIGSKTVGLVMAVASGIGGLLMLPWTRRQISRAVHRRINEPV